LWRGNNDLKIKIFLDFLPLFFKNKTRNSKNQENDTKKRISPQTQERNLLITQLQHSQLSPF